MLVPNDRYNPMWYTKGPGSSSQSCRWCRYRDLETNVCEKGNGIRVQLTWYACSLYEAAIARNSKVEVRDSLFGGDEVV